MYYLKIVIYKLNCIEHSKAKEELIEYFLEHRYGQDYYTPVDLQEIFRKMDAVGVLFPSNDSDMIDAYSDWREKHHKYWFQK